MFVSCSCQVWKTQHRVVFMFKIQHDIYMFIVFCKIYYELNKLKVYFILYFSCWLFLSCFNQFYNFVEEFVWRRHLGPNRTLRKKKILNVHFFGQLWCNILICFAKIMKMSKDEKHSQKYKMIQNPILFC